MERALLVVGLLALFAIVLKWVFFRVGMSIEKRRAGKYQWKPDLDYEITWKLDRDTMTRGYYYSPLLTKKSPKQIATEERSKTGENHDRHQQLD